MLLLFTFSASAILIVNKVVDRGDYYRIDKNITSVILGHSHAESAFNDSLIDHFKNFAQSGESYFYTYYKLKKILGNNQQVKTVFVEFTNNQVNKEMDGWIWNDENVLFRYPKYAATLDCNGLLVLFLHNPGPVLSSLSPALKNNFQFLFKKNTDYYQDASWGRYLYLERFKTDSLVNAVGKSNGAVKRHYVEPSAANLGYLQKIVQLCKEKNVAIYFVRSPLHPGYTGVENEDEYQNILTNQFAGIDLLDFKDFPLPNADFADLEHLNYKGAKIFSLFFNDLLNEGLLNKPGKQEMIDKEMSKYKILVTPQI